jgi:gamma-glutamylcyclotransferase (GGCT)/AIG2-like uncharacterized protein YtfP
LHASDRRRSPRRCGPWDEALEQWGDDVARIENLDLVLPHNTGGLDAGVHDRAAQSIGRVGSRCLGTTSTRSSGSPKSGPCTDGSKAGDRAFRPCAIDGGATATSGTRGTVVKDVRMADSTTFTAAHRLATYGTLAPGRVNHHHVSALEGHWLRGEVRGALIAEGWGSEYGFPGVVLDESGESVVVDVLESADLPAHWARLDEFEGPGYQRVITIVSASHGPIEACIYVLRPPTTSGNE